jgi:hypothetical protein
MWHEFMSHVDVVCGVFLCSNANSHDASQGGYIPHLSFPKHKYMAVSAYDHKFSSVF